MAYGTGEESANIQCSLLSRDTQCPRTTALLFSYSCLNQRKYLSSMMSVIYHLFVQICVLWYEVP